MIRIELTETEAATLREVVEGYLSDLRMEIADTDRLDFRESLKERKLFLQELLGRMASMTD